jgi:threonine/homoserine/homoserine lactone efflux protein
MYLALLPQFIQPHEGAVLVETLKLGFVQITVSLLTNAFFYFLSKFSYTISKSSRSLVKGTKMVYGNCIFWLSHTNHTELQKITQKNLIKIYNFQ